MTTYISLKSHTLIDRKQENDVTTIPKSIPQLILVLLLSGPDILCSNHIQKIISSFFLFILHQKSHLKKKGFKLHLALCRLDVI